MELTLFVVIILLKGYSVLSKGGGLDLAMLEISKLGEKVEFDNDNRDIDDFDFGIDDLDEDNTEIIASAILPNDWLTILKNYIKVLSESKQNRKIKYKIRKANELKLLEEELVNRGEVDFMDGEPKKSKCAKMEYDLLTHIHSLPVKKQEIVLDVDGDGIPDVPVVDND